MNAAVEYGAPSHRNGFDRGAILRYRREARTRPTTVGERGVW